MESADALYEEAPAGYLSALPDGTLIRVNATLVRWLGYEHEDLLVSTQLRDLLPPGARVYWETHFAPLLHMQGEVREVALEFLRADGKRLPVLVNASLVRDRVGRPRVVRMTVFDATDRRRYERELLRARAEAESRARAALALAHVVEGVVLVDADGAVALVNPAAESILGVTSAEVVGRAADDAIEGWSVLAERVRLGRPDELAARHIVPLHGMDGERWLAIAAVDTGDGVVYTFRDVTDERDLDRLRSEMVAIVSHEIRTPVTGVYGLAETLVARFDDLDADRRRQLLQTLVEQARRLRKIVDQILVANQLETQPAALELEPFAAPAAVDPVVGGLAVADRGRVIVDVPVTLPVRADLDRLRQVLANLLDNALKYSPGPVRLTARRHEAYVRFTVADDGPGIPPGDRDRVFQKFFRLDPDQRKGVSGTGLGLYIARELVERMHGQIGLLSRDRGTTVFVDVPRAPAP